MAITLKKTKQASADQSEAANTNIKPKLKLASAGKSKAAPAPVLAETYVLSDFATAIDKVGRLAAEAEPIQKQIKELQAKLKPLSEAEKELQVLIDDLEVGDDATGSEIGAEFVAEYKARGSSRSISDLSKVREYLGEETFMELASLKLGDVDAYLTPPQKEQCIVTERTKRGFKVVKRVA